jgi:hypothetical protein
MIIHKKIAIPDSSIKFIVIQELTKDSYKKLLLEKPKIFNINQLYKEQINLWNELQKNYFNIFKNNYNLFIKNLKKEMKKEIKQK